MGLAPLTLKDFQEKSLNELKGVGGKQIELFSAAGIQNLADLLRFYPTRYLDRSKVATINTMGDEEATIFATVLKVGRPFKIKKRNLNILNIDMEDDVDKTKFEVVFFNQPWRENQFQEDMNVVIYGKLKATGRKLQISHPIVDMVGDQTGRIVPVYALPKFENKGFGSIYPPRLFRAIRETLSRSEQRGIYDPLDEDALKELGLMNRQEALQKIHMPERDGEQYEARKRLAFDELLCIQLVLLERREKIKEVKGLVHKTESGEFEMAKQFLSELPYSLTSAQSRVIKEIQEDLIKDAPMHRLLQGDVGSGKTVVAISAILGVIEAGHQAAFLVPTEVLAEQHFSVVNELLSDFMLNTENTLDGERGLRVELLTNRITGNERKKLLNDLKLGEVDLIVGTSALIYEGVDFKSLGLVVVDEQHRFGVNQRASLKEKSNQGTAPDSLAMTATPIPRTVALTIYGDLDISTLDEMPPGRIPIQTRLITEKDEHEQMWEHVRQQVNAGRQVYVVCPHIGDDAEDTNSADMYEEDNESNQELEVSEGSLMQQGLDFGSEDLVPIKPVKKSFKLDLNISVNKVYEDLSHKHLHGLQLAALHGRLPVDEKNSIMEEFRKGDIDVLISTTVIEVGVDVPNATLMVILGAHRFGIAQLHQLRGRVGRSDIKSYCYLVSEIKTERLVAVEETTDGFKLAEKDLELRREGSILGNRQTGKSDLRATSLKQHRDLVPKARSIAEKLLEDGPLVDNHPEWLEEIKFLLGIQEQTEYLTKT